MRSKVIESLTSAVVMIGDSGFLNPPPPMAVSCSKGTKYVSISSIRSGTSISSAKRKSNSAPLKAEEKLDIVNFFNDLLCNGF